MKIQTLSILMAGAVWLSGCADGNFRPYRLDDSFGNTARNTVQAQIADPHAAAHPPVDSLRKMDGYAGVQTIQTYRDGFGQNNQPQGLTINIGSGSSGSSGGSGGQ
ncbi:MAG: hypothetical protein PHG00_03910 [Methylococcales bacterium]|nr:hypothetical protein [Methylococcales bacterium]